MPTICPRCRRPHVDPMTLNSTPANALYCYQHETGADPYCRMIRMDIPDSIDRLRALASLALTLAEEAAPAREAIEAIKGELWPDNNPDAQWTDDTLENVANLMDDFGFKP